MPRADDLVVRFAARRVCGGNEGYHLSQTYHVYVLAEVLEGGRVVPQHVVGGEEGTVGRALEA